MEPMSIALFRVDQFTVSAGHLVAACAAVVLLSLSLLAALAIRSRRMRESVEHDARARFAELVQMQSEMQGRIAAMADVFGSRQAELNHTIGQRLDGMSQRIGATINEQTKSTHDNLRRLQERLAVIDAAQSNIQTLAKDVVGLQAILSNKQTRGAFGQARMETIIADALPKGAYTFQPTLSTGARPDCTIRMPNGAPPLVVDAKFPLEAWNAMRDAPAPEHARSAAQQFRRDLDIHVRDIAEKYLIANETQDTAFLFVPSESIFAEIHEKFESIVQKAHRQRIVIVSPSLLMLSIQVIQAVLKDQRMREQAHLIQGEVLHLMDDLGRLDERVRKLQSHFTMTQRDIEQIVTSTEKLTRRGSRIEAMEFEAEGSNRGSVPEEPAPRSVESRTGLLKLRVVDED
ncbi:DNA recombination protein RmuC [Rhizobiaceae bacterium n13]|uniref:DNA recombination protein RmuC homolog n=1 Tax=Ferirhizobium litorale TaxID=2927786 RepID=A0AAE3QB61_9HYPH|nr:DNA recombination protein RmuC [Fererhizobium litorale]MDI7862179.1 DNA recombination protein RmuC [Fererhizobium litorale]MDI7922547.1 DNA recombination protein RmuC [Fererhizobium litorale]